tara:strand:- start:487 stop:714 length:228 start_codon:yes stop_codon:yes gene_type:complete
MIDFSKLEQCVYAQVGTNQREDEVARGVGETGTQGYEDQGCFHCVYTSKAECPTYYSCREHKRRLELRELKTGKK